MKWQMLCAAALLLTSSASGQASEATYVATYLDVRPPATSNGATLAEGYARATHSDPGNLGVNAFQEIGRANRFVIIESWKDPAAFAEHEHSQHTLEFRDKLKVIQRSPYDQRVGHGFSIDALPAAPGSNTVYVVTHVDVPGARRQEAEALLNELAQPSRADPGHVRYDIYQQNEPRLNHFTVFAAWQSTHAFDAYGGSAHWLQFREKLAPLLGALYDERLYRSLKL